jgi:hypothetical protein
MNIAVLPDMAVTFRLVLQNEGKKKIQDEREDGAKHHDQHDERCYGEKKMDHLSRLYKTFQHFLSNPFSKKYREGTL